MVKINLKLNVRLRIELFSYPNRGFSHPSPMPHPSLLRDGFPILPSWQPENGHLELTVNFVFMQENI